LHWLPKKGLLTSLVQGTQTGYACLATNRKLQAERGQHEGNRTMPEGIIKKLTDKGFGFIDIGGRKDLFFHSSSLQGVSFNELQEGQ
jgi:hypothetical protein